MKLDFDNVAWCVVILTAVPEKSDHEMSYIIQTHHSIRGAQCVIKCALHSTTKSDSSQFAAISTSSSITQAEVAQHMPDVQKALCKRNQFQTQHINQLSPRILQIFAQTMIAMWANVRHTLRPKAIRDGLRGYSTCNNIKQAEVAQNLAKTFQIPCENWTNSRDGNSASSIEDFCKPPHELQLRSNVRSTIRPKAIGENLQRFQRHLTSCKLSLPKSWSAFQMPSTERN